MSRRIGATKLDADRKRAAQLLQLQLKALNAYFDELNAHITGYYSTLALGS